MGGNQASPNTPEKTDLEERRLALDEEIRRREMAVRELEARQGATLSPTKVSLIGAVLTLLGGVIGAGITAWSTRDIEGQKSLTSLQIEELKVEGELDLEKSRQAATENLERKKFETTLIMEAIKTPSRDEAIRNLKFFVSAGFISDPGEKIAHLSDASLPSLTQPSQESSTRAIQSTGLLIARFGEQQFACTGTLVSPIYVITAGHCVGETSMGAPPNPDSTVPPEFSLRIGGADTPLTLTTLLPEEDIALLKLSIPAPANLPIQRWNVREPLPGEPIYLAMQIAGVEAVQLRTCKVGDVQPEEFQHDCETGAGSSGALVIAVADDALLGIHHAANVNARPPVNLAVKMSTALAKLAPVLAASAQ